MTINLTKFFTYAINKEMMISHFENCTVFISEASKLPDDVHSQLTEKYGNDYLNDANLIVFFKTDDKSSFTDHQKEKMFKFTDRALGKGANNLNQSDFKVFATNCIFVKITLAKGEE